MKRRIAILFTLLISTLFLPSIAFGQQGLKLAQLGVDLWPEYDRPEVLVIYRIGLPTTTPLPVELSLRIPASAGAPNAVAARQPDGTLISQTYTTQTDGDWTTLTFTATTPVSQVEYYDPQINKSGSQREFSYTWMGDYPVDEFSVQVQQPFDAYEMTISPDMGPGERGQDGLVYYTGIYGALDAGQTFETTIQYSKDNDNLTTTSLSVDSIGPIDESAQGRSRVMSLLPWIIGGLGLLLLAGGALWFWQSGRNKAEQSPRPRHKPAAQRQAAAARTPAERSPSANPTLGVNNSNQEFVYCSQCGKRAGSSDRFCRACGTPLRQS